MSNTSTLPHFLGLQDADFQLIDRYRVILETETSTLAHSFYDYLLAYPVTAAVFRDFSRERLDALIQKQAEHASALLGSRLDKSWRETMQKIGALHHRLGIEPSWVAGAYVIYWRHWQKTLREHTPAHDRHLLQDALFRLLIGDLMVQLEGYARASRETDVDRLALFDILMSVLANPSRGNALNPEDLLRQICEALPRKSIGVHMAGYVVSDITGDTLTTECLSGVGIPMLEIPKIAGDPCWEALESRKTVIQSVNDPQAPDWIKSLHNRIEEIGIFPFGADDLQGVGMIGVREKGYFHRVGSAYFDAFAHLGELVLMLRNQALRDPLTTLPNRTLFLDRLMISREQTLRNERLLGVAILDLDGFKQINDRLGHGAGDQLLQGLITQLRTQLRTGDILARMGGDEFGIVLPGLQHIDDLEAVCTRLLTAVRTPIVIQGQTVNVSGSLGVTIYPWDDSDASTLIQHADMALYAAKNTGRDRFHLYSLALNESLQTEIAMHNMVEQALRENRLTLHYQPIVSSTGKIADVEALIRLNHPTKGLLLPADFFSALDHPHLARPIGRFVLKQALRQGALWQKQGLKLRISLNISARHLFNSHFMEDLQEALSEHPELPPEQIKIEITESAPLHDLSKAQKILTDCHRLGVHIALDDFGTGNASLTYLQQLPADAIKIDQGFVRDMIDDPKDLAIINAVITTSRMLGLKTIAEGVETVDHANLLIKMGCTYLQGYLFSKPLPATDIPAWIAHFRPLPQQKQNLSPMDILSPILEGQSLRIQKFLRALRRENPFPAHVLEDDAKLQCHLGRWLQGEGTLLFGQSPDYSDILARHERIHHIGRTAHSLFIVGDVTGALHQGEVLDRENRLLLSELLTLTKKNPDHRPSEKEKYCLASESTTKSLIHAGCDGSKSKWSDSSARMCVSRNRWLRRKNLHDRICCQCCLPHQHAWNSTAQWSRKNRYRCLANDPAKRACPCRATTFRK